MGKCPELNKLVSIPKPAAQVVSCNVSAVMDLCNKLDKKRVSGVTKMTS